MIHHAVLHGAKAYLYVSANFPYWDDKVTILIVNNEKEIDMRGIVCLFLPVAPWDSPNIAHECAAFRVTH